MIWARRGAVSTVGAASLVAIKHSASALGSPLRIATIESQLTFLQFSDYA